MSVRIALLGAAALLVLGLGLYLFHEVRTSPAAAEVTPATGHDTEGTEPRVASGTEPSGPADAAPPKQPPDRAARQHEAKRDPEPTPEPAGDDTSRPPIDQKLDAVMSEANKAYDHGDFDEAKDIAKKVLARQPGNTRMLRILVSASCIDGDTAEAQKRYLELSPSDRAQMRTRCDRYGVTFTEK